MCSIRRTWLASAELQLVQSEASRLLRSLIRFSACSHAQYSVSFEHGLAVRSRPRATFVSLSRVSWILCSALASALGRHTVSLANTGRLTGTGGSAVGLGHEGFSSREARSIRSTARDRARRRRRRLKSVSCSRTRLGVDEIRSCQAAPAMFSFCQQSASLKLVDCRSSNHLHDEINEAPQLWRRMPIREGQQREWQ